MSAWQSLGAGWKEGKLLRRLARCVIYLRSSDGAVCTCKKSGQHPDRGKLLVGLANVKQVCVQIVGQNGSRDGAAPNSQTSSDSGSSKPNVYFEFVLGSSARSHAASRTLAFDSVERARSVWEALSRLASTYSFDLEDLDDAIARAQQGAPDDFVGTDTAAVRGGGVAASNGRLSRTGVSSEPLNDVGLRERTNSVSEFFEDEEEDASNLQPARAGHPMSTALPHPSSEHPPQPTKSPKAGSTPRHQRLHKTFLTPRHYLPLTDIVVYETKRWIYMFGRCDPEVVEGNDNRPGVSAETIAPFLKGSMGGRSAPAASSPSKSTSSGVKGSSHASQAMWNKAEFHLMKISRRDDLSDESPQSLEEIIVLDPHIYTGHEVCSLLRTIKAITESEGDVLLGPTTAVAVVGFIRFLRGFYLVLATERSLLGKIAGHAVYGIASSHVIQVWCSVNTREGTSMIERLRRGISKQFSSKTPLDAAEAKYLALFSLIDLTKDFFYSYSYALTHTVQTNLDASQVAHSKKRERESDHFVGANFVSMPRKPVPVASADLREQKETSKEDTRHRTAYELGANDRFVWNRYLVQDFLALESTEALRGAAKSWTVVLLHGSFSQRECDIFGKQINITLVARRSRHFAGTRYLKRGVTDNGKVANDVEIEQIVESVAAGRITSHVQVRGSIPVFWTQETSATNPKPPIVVQREDPTFEAATRHFCDLFERYAEPIVVLDLVRSAENEGPKHRRESLVGDLFRMAVKEMNSQLPVEIGIRYKPLDFKAMSKHTDSKGQFVFDWLFALAEEALQLHGFCAYEPEQMLPGAALNPPIRSPEVPNMSFPIKTGKKAFDPMLFHFGPCTTKKSEALLNGRRVGTFLLREDGNGIQVLSYVTPAEQVDHAVLFQHPRTKQYRLPDGHWASTLEEVICSFGHSFRNELRAGLMYAGHSHFAKEQDLDIYFGKAARNYLGKASTSLANSSYDKQGSIERMDITDLAAIARKLQQHGIYDQLVRDRRYRMHIYMRCFKANELIDAMLEHGFCRSRQDGVVLGRKLQKSGHMHHVLDHHDFQDARLFFRWFNDEAAILAKRSVVVRTGAKKNQKEVSSKNITDGGLFSRIEIDYVALASSLRRGLVVKDRLYRGKMYKQCFIGRDAVGWLASWIREKYLKLDENNVTPQNSAPMNNHMLEAEAVALGRALMAAGKIGHVTSSHTFKNGTLLYRFLMDSRTNSSNVLHDSLTLSQNRRFFVPQRAGTGTASSAKVISQMDGNSAKHRMLRQHGVVRSNCIDCLDRTNVAQWCIGMRMLACQLYVLGVDLCLKRPNGISLGASTSVGRDPELGHGYFTQRLTTAELVLTPKSKIAQIITQMWETLGDRIALQYGGSEAHKKVTGQAVSSGGESGKKKKRKTAEVMTSIRRYYSNSFTDRPKQDAINLFLGMFQPMVAQQAMKKLETVMERRTWETERREGVTSSKPNGKSSTSDSTSAGQRMFQFQHLWELEGDSLPSDFYLHNKSTMENYVSGSLDSILATLKGSSNDLVFVTTNQATEGNKFSATCTSSSGQSEASIPSANVVDAGLKSSRPSVPSLPGVHIPDADYQSSHPEIIKAFKAVHELPYFRKVNERKLKGDWWTDPLKKFEMRAERSLTLVKVPSFTVQAIVESRQGLETDIPKPESLVAFDSLKIMNSTNSSFPRLLELEADIVGHHGLMDIARVHEYESLRMTPRDFGLPPNAQSLVVEMRCAYENLRSPGLRTLGVYCSGDVDSPTLIQRSEIQAEGPIVWQHRRRKSGAKHISNCRVHLLQQFWKIPEYVSAGLAVAPEKDWNSCHNLTVQNTESEDLSLRVIKNEEGFKVESKAGNQMPKKLSSRASMFHGMLETFGLRGSHKDGNSREDAQSGAGRTKKGRRTKELADLESRLAPELPIDGDDIENYQEYVSRGHNSWQDGLRAEEALFEELHGFNNGLPNKRILEIFRHTNYLHADPHDLEAMRMVQSAGGATLMIKHGAFRGLRQDSPAVETKAALDSLLWNFETNDIRAFQDSIDISSSQV